MSNRLLSCLALLSALVWAGCHPPPPSQRDRGPLGHHAYVWQRSWSPPVSRDVARQGPSFSRIVVLAAEVDFHPSHPQIHRAQIDWNALRTAESLALAIRIQSFRGSFDPHEPPYLALAALATDLLSIARRNQLDPGEIHLDFDSSESQLAGYAQWVDHLRVDVFPARVVITALPAWMNRSQFNRLARTADGVVLQVHALRRPTSPSQPFTLCDPAQAIDAVERMAKLGLDFEVALPTYGYLLVFGATGQLTDVVAEESLSELSPDAIYREVWTDPTAMAKLVRGWENDRPANLVGITWYRMPVSTDCRNWAWSTLTNVMEGTIPLPRLEARGSLGLDQATEVQVHNLGTATARGRWKITARWSDASLLAAEALPGFRLARRDRYQVTWTNVSPADAIRPGESHPLGWLRLTPPRIPDFTIEQITLSVPDPGSKR